MTLTAIQRRAITQRTGAQVKLGAEAGTVTGHYDDDSVYVDFGQGSERCWTNALEFIAEASAQNGRKL